MLNLSNSNKELRDNALVVENESGRMAIGRFTDSDMKKIMAYAKSLNGSNPISNELHIEEPKKVAPKQKIVGKVGYQDDFTTVTDNNGEYRLYIHCPIKGDKGDRIRYAIKNNAKKDFGATFGGNFDSGDIYWVFPNKTKANAFVKARKDYAKANAK